MKVIALLVASALCHTSEANLATALKGWKGKTASNADFAGACKAMGKTFQGWASSGSPSKMTLTATCSGQSVKILCKGSPFTCCHSASAAGSAAACAKIKPGPKCSWKEWKCPTTSGVGAAPSDAKDAKAFIAVHNVYRCMHNVQPVIWDAGVHADAKKWAQHTGKAMVHSTSPSSYRKGSDGENLAGTFKYSVKPGVDATHMWYEEIAKDCHYSKKCYQSFSAGHFTAMMWSSIDKIAYSDTTGELAVGRYRGCDDSPPNFNDQYKDMVHPPVHDYGYCLDKVLGCDAFKGLTEDNLDGCEASAGMSGGKWHMVYAKKCKAKWAGIVGKLTSRLNDDKIPQLFQPLLANAGVLGLGVALLVVGSLAVVLRKRRRLALDHPFVDTEGGEMGEGQE